MNGESRGVRGEEAGMVMARRWTHGALQLRFDRDALLPSAPQHYGSLHCHHVVVLL